ncbi:DNA mismatch repair protein MutT [Bacteroidia bacterium]|nr:DNA mismatch repair protein MutT [Bacteroidia bacterium]GHT84439.1 DNA mismatch repair protein MutT [Bacteroidia bacterium]GHU83915.1 DNA mismatch repair protein MutT [Bacteroidia bacterium]
MTRNLQELNKLHPLISFKYCPQCGSNRFVENNFKSNRCEDCGFVYYFNSSAAVAAFITNSEGELLVVRRAKEPVKGTLDLPGGFVDLYETAEEAVIREVREETGLLIRNPQYLFSLPNIYTYSKFDVHTIDLFYKCRITDLTGLQADDDAAELYFLPKKEIQPELFGLNSIRKAIEGYLNA